MGRAVQCIKLGREAAALESPPYPGDLGQRIFEQVSAEAWQLWVQQQTILINEHRLSPIEPKALEFLEREMEQFFFGPGNHQD